MGGCAAARRVSWWLRRTPRRAHTGLGSRAACLWPTSRTRLLWSRAVTSRVTTLGRCYAGCSSCDAIPGEEFPWDPALGDAFNAREAELERRVGRSAAGWLSAGRPRREAFRVGLRLTARAGVRELHDALLDQAAALAAHARETKTALATDYTYLQPAQPTTVGHLLLAYAYPALRDADRARNVHASLGASVAGAGGSAGSRWALDRARLAELLGCETLVEHAKDAAWQADVYLDLLAALAIAATHQIAARPGLRDLRQPGVRPRRARRRAQPCERADAAEEEPVRARGDPHPGRPGRRRPRRRAHGTAHRLGSNRPLPPPERHGPARARRGGRDRTSHGIRARGNRAPARTLRARSPARASSPQPTSPTYSRSRASSTTAVPTRWSAAPSATSSTQARSPSNLTPERLAAAAETALGRPVAIDDAVLRDALDPAACAAARRQTGSSAESAMDAMLADIEEAVTAHAAWSARAQERQATADAALRSRAHELSGSA